ncbi:MAG: heparinase II/III family protein, partial [Pseudomonadota bacterium]
VALLLDLLPLEQCFKARNITPPTSLAEAIKIVLATLRHLQLGDTGLARFNGMGARSSAALATVLAYDDLTDPKRAKTTLERNGYVRLVMCGSVLIMDAGKPPPFECSGAAHAGCLSFEWSYRGENILVNGGTPSGASSVEHVSARSTASHNTLRLNEESSSELVRHTSLETAIGAIPLRGPSTVSVTAEILPEDDDVFAEEDDLTPVGVEAMHDGYLERHGLIHQRRVEFANDGCRLFGTDTLSGHNQSVRLARDLPFAIHFHLPPKINAQLIDSGRRVKLHLPNGGAVIFAAEGALIGIEPSLFYASSCGPLNTEQIVLRGSTFGESDVAWSFEVLPQNV